MTQHSPWRFAEHALISIITITIYAMNDISLTTLTITTKLDDNASNEQVLNVQVKYHVSGSPTHSYRGCVDGGRSMAAGIRGHQRMMKQI
jgi:hypothetical protein